MQGAQGAPDLQSWCWRSRWALCPPNAWRIDHCWGLVHWRDACWAAGVAGQAAGGSRQLVIAWRSIRPPLPRPCPPLPATTTPLPSGGFGKSNKKKDEYVGGMVKPKNKRESWPSSGC